MMTAEFGFIFADSKNVFR